MKRFKSALLLATVASGAMITNVNAQELDGTGATSIQSVLVQELNCIDGNNQLSVATGGLVTIAEPTDLANGTFNCSTDDLLSGFSGKYVATGSGFGRQQWRNKTNQFGGTNVNGHGTWSHVQFAFADSSITAQDLLDYNSNAVNTQGGLPVFFPKYVLPVAIAYSPVYGHRASDNKDLRFNVNGQAETWGGIYMDVAAYCGVFNGDIKNWNNIAFDTLNGGPLMDPSDDATRWSNDGVPIRLVGRMDKSGTTDIFTRALAAQCTGVSTQYFANNAEILPYDSASGVDFSTERTDTGLKPGGGATAGGVTPTNRVGREYFNTSTGLIADSAKSMINGATATSDPSPTTGDGTGLFLVANGSGALAAAINMAPDFVSLSDSDYTLNGKVGYIGADFIANSPTGQGLFAAMISLDGVNYALPTAADAIAAVITIRPPESAVGLSGAYNVPAEDRLIRDGTIASRTKPLAWYDVLYPTGFTNPLSPSQTGSLAKPTSGYPITGTTQYLGYQCYTAANLPLILTFLGYNTDEPQAGGFPGIFTSSATGLSAGLLARSNIGAMPANWREAIRETFLKDSAQVTPGGSNVRLGSLNLWMDQAGSGPCAGVTTGM